jgi:hypothetical protein
MLKYKSDWLKDLHMVFGAIQLAVYFIIRA